ncbi:ankyrin repeat-containing protein NPR4-like [Prosopis cineraria]|uniref:ankyrin repeat-containing protein NPR4-like n=1 Tax=Prosopis cineraria TaxID=364024 RepID=UPI002410637D|nr:ankyrin repeat-containing protein NPR4-like [Prosopis cineraria]
MANQGQTLLHQVAGMDYYDGGNQLGVVFQLQDELLRELFDLEHLEMLKEAQEWIKGTAQSCSAVLVLLATMVFAAAYTVPGGTDDNGVPVLLDSPLFLFFTIMDVVGLASSLISVMMFLSILTSPFQMQEFYKSLPRKLTIGFTLLFISLTTTLLAFGSTILLMIRMENKRWS